MVVLAGQDKDREWLLTEKDKFDNEHDKDGNGVLDREEILAWVVPTNEYASLLHLTPPAGSCPSPLASLLFLIFLSTCVPLISGFAPLQCSCLVVTCCCIVHSLNSTFGLFLYLAKLSAD